jgi:hypothetical protein
VKTTCVSVFSETGKTEKLGSMPYSIARLRERKLKKQRKCQPIRGVGKKA